MLTAILMALSAAQTINSAFESRRAAGVARSRGDQEAQLFDINARLAERQADDALARGQESSLRVERRARVVTGEQSVAFAGQGVVAGVGTPSAIMAEDRALSEFDKLTIRNNAAREALGYRTQADGYRMQGQWARQAGANQANMLNRQAWSTMLGGAAGLFATYATAPKSVGGGSPALAGMSAFDAGRQGGSDPSFTAAVGRLSDPLFGRTGRRF